MTTYYDTVKRTLAPRSFDSCKDWTDKFEIWRGANGRGHTDDKLVRDFAAYLVDNNKANSSIKTGCSWIGKYLNWLRDEGKDVPAQKPYDLPRDKRQIKFTPSKEQVAKLVSNCKDFTIPYGYAVGLIPYTGMRDTEIHTLKYDDWSISKDKRVMFHLKQTKNGKARNVPLLRSGEWLFKEYITVRKELVNGQKSDWLFPQQSNPDKCIMRKNVEFYMRKIRKDLQLDKMTCHSLRRYYVTNLMRLRVREIDICQIIGHSDMRTFKLYYQPTAEDLSATLGDL